MLALDPQLLADINPTPASSLIPLPSPTSAPAWFSNNVTAANGFVYFTATDFEHGTELWKSDGSEAGTTLVKDIYAGDWSSKPSHLEVIGNTLYFQATTARGSELWKSDGTEAGTVPVRRIDEGGPIEPFELTNVNGTLLFVGYTSGSGRELWKSDGTAAGTVVVKDITTFPGLDTFASQSVQLSSPVYRPNFTVIGSTLYFIATTQSSYSSGRELWKSDGTPGGTAVVKEIRTGFLGAFDSSAFDAALTNVNGTLYFVADDGVNGAELWKSNGTNAGTTLVKNIGVGAISGFASPGGRIVGVGDTAYFTTNGFNSQLWKSDGTSAGTVVVVGNVTQFREMVAIGSRLYFAAMLPGGDELWSATANGAAIVKDISMSSSTPRWLTNVNGTLYFTAFESTGGIELWKSDGSLEGTVQVSDIRPGPVSSVPGSLAALGSSVFFAANDGVHGVELWTSDGSAAGTALVKDIRPGTVSSEVYGSIELNGLVLFAAYNSEVGRELWRTDGTPAGTFLLADMWPGSVGSSPLNFSRVGNLVYFQAINDNRPELWRTDGTAAGTVRVTEIDSGYSVDTEIADLGGVVFLRGEVGGSGGELMRSDGTAAGTVVVKDIRPGPDGSEPDGFASVGGTMLFFANDGVHGHELWRSDGTEAGTSLVKDIRTGAQNSAASRPTVVGSLLYFVASDLEFGVQLWRSDGTTEGTWRVTNEANDTFSFGPDYLINIDGTLYYSNRTNLWKLAPGDVTPTLVKSIFAGPSNLKNVGGTLFFSAGDHTFGRELWKSDGTEAGTVMVKDIVPGPGSPNFSTSTAAIDGKFYFSIDDGVHGWELWSSDGTEAGTRLEFDLAEGQASSRPEILGVLGSRLILNGATREYSDEVWSATITPSRAGDYDLSGAVNGDDFLAWQRNLGSTASPAGSGADGDGSGTIDAGDMSVWRDNYGTPATAAARAASAVVAAVEDADERSPAPRAIDAVFSAGDFSSLFQRPSTEHAPSVRRFRPLRRY